ncbi:hypothetical protein HZB60_09465 [candidate division KSB1 bacterium]|nr:hypothetical protein [candidate division KSB1 bacterium]
MIIAVDTNVPMVANCLSPQASVDCVNRCLDVIERLDADTLQILLDTNWLIIGEYQDNLNSNGQPGIGDRFLRWVLTNHRNPQRCKLVLLTQIGPPRLFDEFPGDPALAQFDSSDRKFVATTRSYRIETGESAPVYVAVDTDWWVYEQPLSRHDVRVVFVCPVDMNRLATQKGLSKLP